MWLKSKLSFSFCLLFLICRQAFGSWGKSSHVQPWQVKERIEMRTKENAWKHSCASMSDWTNETRSKLDQYDESLSLPSLPNKPDLALWGKWSVTKDVKIMEMLKCVCVCSWTGKRREDYQMLISLFHSNLHRLWTRVPSAWSTFNHGGEYMLTGTKKMAFLSEKCLQTCFWVMAIIASLFCGRNSEGERDCHLAATRLRGVEMMSCQVIWLAQLVLVS